MEIVSRPGTGTTVKGHVIALPLGETAPDTGAARIGEKPEPTLVRRSG
jgi:hypothetical protein